MPSAYALYFTNTDRRTPERPEPVELKFVLDATFRANPQYELLRFDQLRPGEQELFSALKNDPGFYGLLRPREGSGLAAKSACFETAHLFQSLAAAAPLPPSLTRTDDLNRQIAELVLDGVLQIQHRDEMLCGPAAFSSVCVTWPRPQAATAVARLSYQALRYAQTLPFRDANTLSARLYSWGRIPVTPSWRQKFPDEHAVRQCLLLDDGAKNALRLTSRWQALPPNREDDGWLFWQSLRPYTGAPAAAYKLYVSPHPAYLREAFEVMIPALERNRANAFKIGKDLSGVLRPDKMIAYFSHFDQAQEAAARILTQLRDCPAHGVPFTCQLGSPLLSWGSDPPTQRNVPAWLSRQSWRLYITNRLAVSLAQAMQQADFDASLSPEPWKFAVDRLSLEGVDTTTWSPLRKEQN